MVRIEYFVSDKTNYVRSLLMRNNKFCVIVYVYYFVDEKLTKCCRDEALRVHL